MKHFLLLINTIFSVHIVLSQNIVDSFTQKEITKKFKDIIPEGYIVIDTAESDFDNNNLKDIAFVLKVNNYNSDTSRAIIITKNVGGKYEVVAKCLNAILCEGCGGIFGDQYAGVSFKKNM